MGASDWIAAFRPSCRTIASDDISTDPGEATEHVKRRHVQDDGLFSRLAVREKQQAPVETDMLPSEVEDFAKARAGEDQQAKRCRRMGTDDSEAISLRNVLGFLSRIDDPWRADCLRFANGKSQPFQFAIDRKRSRRDSGKRSMRRAGLNSSGVNPRRDPKLYMLPTMASMRFA